MGIIAFVPLSVTASETSVQRLEGEIFAGFTVPLESYHGSTPQISVTMGIEGRYNFPNAPWDCGVMLALTGSQHGYSHLYDDGYDRWQNNRTLSFDVSSHYNFRQGKNVNPFVGCAVGIAFNSVVGDMYFPSEGVSMLFAPRVGIEFIRHIRVTSQFNICRKGYNNFSVALGFVLGGRPKKDSQKKDR